MARKTQIPTKLPDNAAQFAAALSLWQPWKQAVLAENPDLSECYDSMDQLRREVVRVANHFEMWASLHVDFDMLDESWPHLLEKRFGEACLDVLPPNALARFDNGDCLRVAVRLDLPINFIFELVSPIDVRASNPIAGSPFPQYRIQTVRDSIYGESTAPFTLNDDPSDGDFSEPYVRLYGVSDGGVLEHIADRKNYREVVKLARKLAPGVKFPLISY